MTLIVPTLVVGDISNDDETPCWPSSSRSALYTPATAVSTQHKSMSTDSFCNLDFTTLSSWTPHQGGTIKKEAGNIIDNTYTLVESDTLREIINHAGGPRPLFYMLYHMESMPYKKCSLSSTKNSPYINICFNQCKAGS